ncbi:hypothetical protein DUI87_05666 [Hirundo rustica rustica]|uniref:Uncharacterized protein n=1 Tax=Hirundo rustica rustica TaxID=333673 RepID=A0A3M0KUX0_HIRRU|nr:hypothetical protein DUI87_05666 [Hirundo rustica rustica]
MAASGHRLGGERRTCSSEDLGVFSIRQVKERADCFVYSMSIPRFPPELIMAKEVTGFKVMEEEQEEEHLEITRSKDLKEIPSPNQQLQSPALMEFRVSKKESNSLPLDEVSLDISMVFRQKGTRSDLEKLPQTD